MAATFIQLATINVGSGGASTLTFSGISAIYKDLAIMGQLRTDRTSQAFGDIWFRFNNDSNNRYGRRFGSDSGGTFINSSDWINTSGNNQLASTFAPLVVYIPNYRSSNYAKQLGWESSIENNSTSSVENCLAAAIWADASEISSFSIYEVNGGTFLQHSTLTLYGISNT
jgi:hypothetical protein